MRLVGERAYRRIVLRPPIEVQRPARVARLSVARPGSVIYQAKLDGWRCLAFVGDEVALQARSGRIVTERFPEILAALADLPPCVLDGEVTAVRDGVLDFHALAGSPAHRFTSGVALSFVAFDLLQDAAGADLRRRPLRERWDALLALLDGAPTQVQPVLSTLDRDEALAWMGALTAVGIEGIVAKTLSGKYTPGVGHGWIKVRAEETVDAEVLGAVGPTMLRVRLDDGTDATTEPLGTVALREVADALADAVGPLRVELRAGHGRHGVVRYVRVRAPE